MSHKMAVQLYDLWRASNFVAYPYPGGMLTQPWWIVDDFHQLSSIDSWCERAAKEARDKPPKYITFDDSGNE